MPVDVKQVIAETFAGLLEHKNVEKITVKELVDACHISRQTFYYHFQDTMEVIEYLMEQRLQKTLLASLEAPSVQDALKSVITVTSEEKRLIRHLLSSQRREEMSQLLRRFFRAYFDEMIRAHAAGRTLPASDLETAVSFYSYGVVGLLLDNLTKEQNPDILAQQISGLISGEIWRESGTAS